jgi:hypothetical protein
MRNAFGRAHLDWHPPCETSNHDALGRRRHSVSIRKRVTIRGAARGEGRFARVPPVVIRREHGRVPQGEDVLEHGLVRLRCAGALPPRVEPPPQYVAPRFGTLQALVKKVALAAAVFEFGTEAPTTGQMPNEVTNESAEPGH